MRTSRKAAVAAATIAALTAGTLGTVGVVVSGAPAGAAASRVVAIAPGVSLRAYSFGLDVGWRSVPEKITVLTVVLGPHTRLVPASSTGTVGGARANTLAIARRERAVAGVNGDFFDLSDDFAPPRGGLMKNGLVMKSGRPDTAATLYLTTSDRALIGDPGFSASVTSNGMTHAVGSTNNLTFARRGELTLTDNLLESAWLPGCTVATLNRVGTGRAQRTVVGGVFRNLDWYKQLPVGRRALVGCGNGGRWLAKYLQPTARTVLQASHKVRNLRSYIGGGTVLLRNGVAYQDTRSSIYIPNWYRNPLTFACTSADGRTVRLGTVDGRADDAAGMTYGELTRFLRDSLHCSSAMTFDGGGSSTLVARMPGKRTVSVRNQPSDDPLRTVADGLFVVSS